MGAADYNTGANLKGTKEEIFAVKDRTKRQQLIAENMHLFE